MTARTAGTAVVAGGGTVATGYFVPELLPLVYAGALVIGLVLAASFAVVLLSAARSTVPKVQRNSAAVLDKLLAAARPGPPTTIE